MTLPIPTDIIILEKRGKCDVLERLLINELFLWKNRRSRKPLILTGARQVGKTWLLKEFSTSYFEDSLYIDLKKSPKVKNLFNDTISPRRAIEILGALFGTTVEPYKTLLILDNIQELPHFEKILKRFSEDVSQYFICCGTTCQNISNDTNAFSILKLFPFSFEEFLLANEEDLLIDFFRAGTLTYLPKLIEDKLLDYLKLYFIIGGMPSSIDTWIQTQDFIKVEEQLSRILNLYEEDFNLLINALLAPKVTCVWESLSKQLAKENRKFMYGSVRAGARSREYQEALDWILNNSYGTAIFALKDPSDLSKSGIDTKSFRVFLPDIGLLRMIYKLPYQMIHRQNQIFEEFNYTLTLQFVFQELLTKMPSEKINYWTSNATAQIDFLLQYNQLIYPLEINVNDNLKARSIRIYQERFSPKGILRTSLSSLRVEESLLNIPISLLFNLENYLINLL